MSEANGRTIPTSPSDLANQLPGILMGLDSDNVHAVSAHQPTVAAAILSAALIRKPGKFTGLVAKALVGGTAGTTTVKVKKIPKDGVVAAAVEVATVDLPNADADGKNYAGTLSAVAGALDLATGDLLYLEVTAAATGATGLTAMGQFEHLAG